MGIVAPYSRHRLSNVAMPGWFNNGINSAPVAQLCCVSSHGSDLYETYIKLRTREAGSNLNPGTALSLR